MKQNKGNIHPYIFILFYLFLLLFHSCSIEQDSEGITIAVTKGKGSTGYEQYGKWLKSYDPSVRIIDLYHKDSDSAMIALEGCDALLIAVGPDVNPALYEQAGDTVLCGKIDHFRDTLEFRAIEIATNNNMPILGICRGQQILNVYHGGNLIVDIPTQADTIIKHRCDDKNNCLHDVILYKNSLLFKYTGLNRERVNSSHHQAIKDIADVFIVAGKSPDGIIEAIEWKNKEDHGYLLAVQWHPEWMPESHPFSAPLALNFINAAKAYAKTR